MHYCPKHLSKGTIGEGGLCIVCSTCNFVSFESNLQPWSTEQRECLTSVFLSSIFKLCDNFLAAKWMLDEARMCYSNIHRVTQARYAEHIEAANRARKWRRNIFNPGRK